MKLASLRDGSRDGQLLVVSRTLERAHSAADIAPTLQRALDDWNFISPQLQDLYDALNAGRARHGFPFDPSRCEAPLPRVFQRLAADVYPSHAERLGHAPLALRQRSGDNLIGPTDPIAGIADAMQIDVAPGLAAVIGDVPRGTPAVAAGDAIRLLLLMHDVVLRRPGPEAGDAVVQPVSAFAPVAVTPDELGEAWREGRACLTLRASINGTPIGARDAGAGMSLSFAELVARACQTRHGRSGSIIGAGPVSGPGEDGGYLCLAERHAGVADGGEAVFLRQGDVFRLEALDGAGRLPFGAIDQCIGAPAPVQGDD